jgi:DNA topoisomerase VI subunit B
LELLTFGAVLSGTKYGLRQTHGKFGLGAKMVKFFVYAVEKKLSKLYAAVNYCFVSF